MSVNEFIHLVMSDISNKIVYIISGYLSVPKSESAFIINSSNDEQKSLTYSDIN